MSVDDSIYSTSISRSSTGIDIDMDIGGGVCDLLCIRLPFEKCPSWTTGEIGSSILWETGDEGIDILRTEEACSQSFKSLTTGLNVDVIVRGMRVTDGTSFFANMSATCVFFPVMLK